MIATPITHNGSFNFCAQYKIDAAALFKMLSFPPETVFWQASVTKGPLGNSQPSNITKMSKNTKILFLFHKYIQFMYVLAPVISVYDRVFLIKYIIYPGDS